MRYEQILNEIERLAQIVPATEQENIEITWNIEGLCKLLDALEN